MSGPMFYLPKQQNVDTSGNPLAGAKLHFYEINTTTNKNVYQDAALTSAHANPVVADADGRWEPIFLNGIYDVVMKTSADVTIYSEDDVEVTAPLFNGIVSTSTTLAVTYAHKNKVIRCTAALTLNLLGYATAGEGFPFGVVNVGSGNVTIDANSTETINGSTTIVLGPGDSAILVAAPSAVVSGWLAFVTRGDITALTVDSTPDITADKIRTYDASAAAYKAVLLQTLLTRFNAGMMALSSSSVSWDTGVLTPGNYVTSGTTYTGTLPLGASTEHTGMLSVMGGNGSTNDIQQIWFNGLIAGIWHRMTTDGGTAWTVWREISHATPSFGGRLTTLTATPVQVADAAAQTTVYYTPYVGDKIALYNGAEWYNATFAELSQATTDATKSPAAATTDSNYDVFVWNDSGTLRATRGPAWSSATARGTGAGTTELVRVNGIYLNANTITNGPAAQRGTYVGSIRTNASSQVDVKFGVTPAAGGSAAILGIWNAYNRVSVVAATYESTDSWTYTTGSFQQWSAAAGANNDVSFIRGLNEEPVSATFTARAQADTAGDDMGVGIGLDSITVATGRAMVSDNQVVNQSLVLIASYDAVPGLGFHYLAALEYGSTTVTFYGDNGAATTTQSGMVIRTTW